MLDKLFGPSQAGLEKLFGVSKAGSSIRIELLAGLATFLTMAYITIVNPLTLATEGTGMEFGAVSLQR